MRVEKGDAVFVCLVALGKKKRSRKSCEETEVKVAASLVCDIPREAVMGRKVSVLRHSEIMTV